MNTDLNLLFGIFALQAQRISRDALIRAMSIWVTEKHRALGDILLELNAISKEDHAATAKQVQEMVEKSGGDPSKTLSEVQGIGGAFSDQDLASVDRSKTLSEMPGIAGVAADLWELKDRDVQVSLCQVAATIDDPSAKQARLSHPRPSHAVPAHGDATMAQPVESFGSIRFSVKRPLAHGGLGEVVIAQDNELHREVALKRIRGHLADMKDNRDRFEMEAEITGRLEHPGIVPVYSLGKTGDGRPYYAMRFIVGTSLEKEIRKFHNPHQAPATQDETAPRRLTMRDLLQRFISVCEAIGYAHSRSVLHRDLKPDNIMLGDYGETLVVDWGLAKSLDSPIPQKNPTLAPIVPSIQTETHSIAGSVSGTPPYMGPEQAAGRHAEMDQSADIYSLGATLYCLLVGQAPIVDKDVGVVLQKAQRGEFPPPRAVKPDVPRPLEAIVMKAMALSPEDRYSSAKALAADVQHYLADEPVSVYRDPPLERLYRWMRKHRGWAQAIAASLLIISVVSVLASVLISRAREKEEAARIEAQKQEKKAEASFADARKAVNDFFTQVSENRLLNVPNLQPLRKELLEAALTFYRKFLQDRAQDRSLERDIAAAHYRVGRIMAEIDKRDDSLKAYESARKIQERLVQAEPKNAELKFELSNTINAMGDVYFQLPKFDSALAAFQKARTLRDEIVKADPKNAAYRRRLANGYANIAGAQFRLRQPDSAQIELQNASKIRQELVEEHPDDPQFRRDQAQGFFNAGYLFEHAGNFEEAEQNYRLALEKYRDLTEKYPKTIDFARELAVTYRVLGILQDKRGQFTEAELSFKEAIDRATQLAKRNPFLVELQAEVAATHSGMGRLHQRILAKDAAMAEFQQAQSIQEQLVDYDPSISRYKMELASTLTDVGKLLYDREEFDEAQKYYVEARQFYQEPAEKDPQNLEIQDALAALHTNMGLVHRRQGRTQQALDEHLQTKAIFIAWLKGRSSNFAKQGLADALLNIAVEQRTLKRPAESLATLQEARKLQEELKRARPELPIHRRTLGEINYLLGVMHGERGMWQESFDAYKKSQLEFESLTVSYPDDPDFQRLLGVTQDEQAEVLRRLGRKEEAWASLASAGKQLAGALAKQPEIGIYRENLSGHLAHMAEIGREAGKFSESATAIEERKKLWPGNPGELYSVAADFAKTAAAGPEPQRGALNQQAVQTLKEAVAAGFKDFDKLRTDPDLASLREQPEVKALLEKGK